MTRIKAISGNKLKFWKSCILKKFKQIKKYFVVEFANVKKIEEKEKAIINVIVYCLLLSNSKLSILK